MTRGLGVVSRQFARLADSSRLAFYPGAWRGADVTSQGDPEEILPTVISLQGHKVWHGGISEESRREQRKSPEILKKPQA